MKKFSPNWIWFIAVFLVALIVTGIIAGGKSLFTDPDFVFAGLQFFPVGIAAVIDKITHIHTLNAAPKVSIIGYLIYFALVIYGSIRKSPTVWIILVCLLMLNIVGCHFLSKALSSI